MTDHDLKIHVSNALEWEPSLDASLVGVSVNGGVVTLQGTVPSYSARSMAERVALRVFGVKAVANDLTVELRTGFERSDTDIAQAVLNAIAWNALLPKNGITPTVSNGWVTLNGQVDWFYEQNAATRAVRDLIGVKGVTNNLKLRPHVSTGDVRSKIEAAFKRSAEVDARRVNVTATDGKVILSGTVHSWSERREAERAAWAAPGVTQVDDRLTIVP